MAREVSGSNGGGGAAVGEDGGSGVTEVGSNGNAARWGSGEDWLSTFMATEGEEAAAVNTCVDEEEEKAAAGECLAPSPPGWLRPAAARLGWLVLGFIAGAALAATVMLFVKHDGYPETWTVPT